MNKSKKSSSKSTLHYLPPSLLSIHILKDGYYKTVQTKQLGSTDLNVSLIGLGTVEIGLPYGLGKKRLPSDQEAERILKTAIELGITYIDTARGYGVAEERIGKSGISKLPGIVIGTKCAQFLEKGEDPQGTELEQRIRSDVEESLRFLRLDSLPLLQLHGGTTEQIERGELIEILQKLKDEGKVQHIGIATRGEEAPLVASASGFFETIQTAYSILDQRMQDQVLPAAQKDNVGIINRSVLLKGTLTPQWRELPDALAPLRTNAERAEHIATDLGLDLPTLALRFVLSNPAVSTALIGTFEPAHLEAAAKATTMGPLPENVLAQLYDLAINDPTQVDPARWLHV